MFGSLTGRTQWRPRRPLSPAMVLVLVLVLFGTAARASVGDRLPSFRECVEVGPTSCFRAGAERTMETDYGGVVADM